MTEKKREVEKHPFTSFDKTNNFPSTPYSTLVQNSTRSVANLEDMSDKAILQMEKSLKFLKQLSTERQKQKMSSSRINGVIRELNELLKVMSIYKPQRSTL